jgi:hypothetical protein
MIPGEVEVNPGEWWSEYEGAESCRRPDVEEEEVDLIGSGSKGRVIVVPKEESQSGSKARFEVVPGEREKWFQMRWFQKGWSDSRDRVIQWV